MRTNILVIVHVLYIFFASFIGLFFTLFLVVGLFSFFIDRSVYFYNEIHTILKDCFHLSIRGAFLLSIIPFVKVVLFLIKNSNNK